MDIKEKTQKVRELIKTITPTVTGENFPTVEKIESTAKEIFQIMTNDKN